MEQTYTQAQLVSFGNYLLNLSRVKRFVENAAHSNSQIQPELVLAVHDADLANWSAEGNLPYDGNADYETITIPMEDEHQS